MANKGKRNWWTTGAAIGFALSKILAAHGIIDTQVADAIESIFVALGFAKARDGKVIAEEKEGR